MGEVIDNPITVPPRRRSQSTIRSSKPPPKPLQKRKSDGKQGRWPIHPNLPLQFYLGAIGGATSAIPSTFRHRLPVLNIDDSKPVKFFSPTVDPTAAYQNKPDWKSTLHASTGLVIDVVKESSDVFTPLKAVAGGLSAILRHYDV